MTDAWETKYGRDFSDFIPYDETRRRRLSLCGEMAGTRRAESDYPYTVTHTRNDALIDKMAMAFWPWVDRLQANTEYWVAKYEKEKSKKEAERWRSYITLWNSYQSESLNLFGVAFIYAYLNKVSELDAKEAAKRQPPPQPKPAPKPIRYKYDLTSAQYREKLKSFATLEGVGLAEATYPYTVQTRSEVEAFARSEAEKNLRQQIGAATTGSSYDEKETNDPEKYRLIYIANFQNGYIKKVEELGKNNPIKQSNSSGAASKVLTIEKNETEYIYEIEIIDLSNPMQSEIIYFHKKL